MATLGEKLQKWRTQYDSAVVSNVALVGTAENAMRTLSYVMPSSVPDSELSSEVLFALSKLVSIYNDVLISKQYKTGPHVQPTQASRYTSAWLADSHDYAVAAYSLTVLQAAELLTEMVAVRLLGQKHKWKVVALIEVFKMVCRLVILNITKKRMVLQAVVPEGTRTVAPNSDSTPGPAVWKGKRSGRSFATLAAVRASPFERPANIPGATNNGVIPPSEGEQEDDPSNQAVEHLTRQSGAINAGPVTILSVLDNQRLLSEVLFAIRPVLYVLAIIKYGKSSWKPWVISLAVEALSRGLAHYSKQQASSTEVEEYNKRNLLFVYYLLREPLFGVFSKSILADVADIIEKLPFGALVAGGLKEYAKYWENYYFYTNAS